MESKVVINAFLIALLAVCASLWMQRSSQSTGPAAAADTYAERVAQAVAPLSKELRIQALEVEVDRHHREVMGPLLQAVSHAQQQYNSLHRGGSWFPSAAERATLAAAEASLNRARAQLGEAEARGQALTLRLKPLYGLVSAHFFAEQRSSIKSSLKTVSNIAYENAWWTGLSNMGRAESLTDLLVQFVLDYAGTYIIAYPFAWLYFVFWTAPWTIYGYTGSVVDLPTAIGMWVAWAAIMAIPLVVLGAGFYYYSTTQRARARQAREGQRFEFQ
jgi:hypothetical protein